MKIAEIIKPFFLIVSVFMLAGCAITNIDTKDMYVQPDLPSEQVASINRVTQERFIWLVLYSLSDVVLIHSIDGKRVEITSKLKLLPGQHEIAANYVQFSGMHLNKVYLRTNLFITVEAGREYQIRGSAKGGKNSIWVEDQETKTIVGISSTFVEE